MLAPIGVDADDGELAVDSPVRDRPKQPRADRQHGLSLAPPSTPAPLPNRPPRSGGVTLTGARMPSAPRPRRKPSTGACNSLESVVPSADASCAPPPQMISTRSAAPRRLAARRNAAMSILGAGIGM